MVKIIPKENKETDLIRIASDLVDVTRSEPKNVFYDFVSSLEDNSFLFIEKWEDMEGLNNHFNSSHFRIFDHLSKIFVEDTEITVYDGEQIDLIE